MKYNFKTFTIGELTSNAFSINDKTKEIEKFEDEDQIENGLYSMDGMLEIRPTFQREFIWREREQVKFIQSILRGWVTNPIYLAVEKDMLGVPTGRHLMLDGQQRGTTEVKFKNNLLEVDCYGEKVNYDGLSDADKKKFDSYEVVAFVIDYDNEDEMIEHFNSINQKTTILTRQELRNATYNGVFVEELKLKFGKKKCDVALADLYSRYLNLNTSDKDSADKIRIDRQEVVERAILWTLVLNDDDIYSKLETCKDHDFKNIDEDYLDNKICNYMRTHRLDDNCSEIWNNFVMIIKWVNKNFGNCRNISRKSATALANVKNWAYLYRKYSHQVIDSKVIEKQSEKLFKDIYVHHKFNIPEYVLMTETNKDIEPETLLALAKKMLSIDSFPEFVIKAKKAEMYDEATGYYICPECGEKLTEDEIEFHHIIAWTLFNGMNVNDISNCKGLCHKCHKEAHNMSDEGTKAYRQYA